MRMLWQASVKRQTRVLDSDSNGPWLWCSCWELLQTRELRPAGGGFAAGLGGGFVAALDLGGSTLGGGVGAGVRVARWEAARAGGAALWAFLR